MNTKVILLNIFKNKFLRNVFIIITILLLVVPIVSYQKISDTFKNEIMLNINNDANKIAKHIYTRHFGNDMQTSLKIGMLNVVKDFNIYKVKFFDADGIVVNSTVESEIGTKNKYAYFYDEVTKGNVYYHLVQKGMTSLEDKTVTRDVVEIYIPIMDENKFQGSFELYYDVTEKISSFNSLINKLSFSEITITVMIFVIFILILYYGSKSEMTQKQIEKELVAQKSKAEEANLSKSVFLASMSHELRTPLNSIIGFNELLLNEEDDPNKQKKLKIVNTSSKMLLQLINDVLDFTKIESNKVELDNINISLHEELKNICDVFIFQIESKNINFMLNIEDNVPENIIVDPLRVKQIVMNLLSNAIKFTPENKFVQVNLSYEPKKSEISIEVIDEGIGISKDKHTVVFEKFSQADNTITRKFGGTGLGLAISKTLANAMGGDISLESEIGHGSNFTLTLPVEVVIPEAKVTENVSDSFDLSKYKVLLVEDNEFNQIVFLEMIKKYKLEVEIANNGVEALTIYKNNDFDLIFMDDQMPVMDGLTTIEEMKKLDINHPPIIAFTASTAKEDKDKYFNAGASDFLCKPVDINLLSNILKVFLIYKNELIMDT